VRCIYCSYEPFGNVQSYPTAKTTYEMPFLELMSLYCLCASSTRESNHCRCRFSSCLTSNFCMLDAIALFRCMKNALTKCNAAICNFLHFNLITYYCFSTAFSETPTTSTTGTSTTVSSTTSTATEMSTTSKLGIT